MYENHLMIILLRMRLIFFCHVVEKRRSKVVLGPAVRQRSLFPPQAVPVVGNHKDPIRERDEVWVRRHDAGVSR